MSVHDENNAEVYKCKNCNKYYTDHFDKEVIDRHKNGSCLHKIVNVKSKEKYDLYIGRFNEYYGLKESIFHNPFVITKGGLTREEVIKKFEEYAPTNKELMDNLYLIDNKILGCWCNWPDEDCHGRILLELRKKQIENNLYNLKKNDENYYDGPQKCLCIIAGSRHLYNYGLVVEAIKESGFKIDEIVCGCAKGVDQNGKIYGKKNNIPVKEFPADWDNLEKQPCIIKTNKYGKKYNCLAGHNRNLEMANYATHAIIIHSNTSGSLNMLKLAKEKGLIIYEKVINE